MVANTVELKVRLANIRTVPLYVKKRGGQATITLPKDIVNAEKLKDKDRIVIAFISKADAEEQS